MPELPAEVVAAIHQALQQIAGMCDGAQALDGHGFNKLDAAYGRWLANCGWLTQKQARSGRKLAIKYGRQIDATLLDMIKKG